MRKSVRYENAVLNIFQKTRVCLSLIRIGMHERETFKFIFFITGLTPVQKHVFWLFFLRCTSGLAR